jgi:hypothetical protein
MGRGTPASSQIVNLERMLEERDKEIEHLRKIANVFARIVIRRTDGTVVLVPDEYALSDASELLRPNVQGNRLAEGESSGTK